MVITIVSHKACHIKNEKSIILKKSRTHDSFTKFSILSGFFYEKVEWNFPKLYFATYVFFVLIMEIAVFINVYELNNNKLTLNRDETLD